MSQPLPGAGSNQRSGDVGAEGGGPPEDWIRQHPGSETHSAQAGDVSHVPQSMQFQNLLPALCFFLVGFAVLVYGKKIPAEAASLTPRMGRPGE